MIGENLASSVGSKHRGGPLSTRLPSGLLFLALALGLLASAISAPLPRSAIAFGALALAAYCFGLLLVMADLTATNGLGLADWRIGPWSLVWGAVAFGLATISWLAPQTGLPGQILPGSILRALWLIAVAVTMLAAGYLLGPHRFAARPAARATAAMRQRFSDDIRSPAVPWLLFGIGVLAQALNVALTGRLGDVGDIASAVSSASGYGQLLATAAECAPLAVAAAATRAYRTQAPGSRLTLFILFIAVAVLGAVAGGKQSFAVAVLAVVIPGAAARRKLPKGLIALAALLFLMLIIPFNQAYRSTARGAVALSVGQAVAQAPAIFRQIVAADSTSSVITNSATYLAQRIRDIDSPAIILQRTPSQIPYGSAAQLMTAPLVDIIPRALWPGKPILVPGYIVSQEYYGLPSNVYTSSAITPEGDLYRHGGWIPLIFGMFLLGCGLRVMDDVLNVRANPQSVFLIILLFPDLVKAETDWIGLLAGIPSAIVLSALVVSFSFKRRSHTTPEAGQAGRPLLAINGLRP